MATESIEKRIEKDPVLSNAVNEAVPTGDGGGRAPTRYEKGRRTESLAKNSHQKKVQSSGVGESRPFIAEPGTFEDAHDWSELTLNGEPIPEHLWAQLPYGMTDQGAAERRAEDEALGRQAPRARVTREAHLASAGVDELLDRMHDRSIEQSVEQYRESLELMEQEDPLGVLMKRHVPVGHRGLFMSDRVCNSGKGMRRGALEYQEVVVDGKRVQHGGMFLASVPEALAIAAERHYAAKGMNQTKAAVEQVKELRDQVMGETGMRRQNRRGDIASDGLEFLEPGDDGGMRNGEFGTSFRG